MPARDLILDESLTIPGELITLSFVRSSGSGGQNVNKVSSQVEMRVQLEGCPLPDAVMLRLKRSAGKRLTLSGELLITSQRFRDQSRNIEDCYQKLQTLIEQARVELPPRRPTRPSRGVIQHRLNEKRIRSTRLSGRKVDSGG